MQHVSYVHICPQEQFMRAEKINDWCNVKMKSDSNTVTRKQKQKSTQRHVPDKNKTPDMATARRKKQRKLDDCTESSFDNTVLHDVTQNNLQSAALLHGSILNYTLSVVYNNK